MKALARNVVYFFQDLWDDMNQPMFSEDFSIKRVAVLVGVVLLLLWLLVGTAKASHGSARVTESRAPVVEMVSDNVYLTTEACTDERITVNIEEAYWPEWRRAKVAWMGKMLEACWTLSEFEIAPGRKITVVLIIDEEKDTGMIPLAAFEAVSVKGI